MGLLLDFKEYSNKKKPNNVYNSLIGGYCGRSLDINGKPDGKSWQYTFLYGICSFSKNWSYKIDTGNNYCFSINTHSKYKNGFAYYCHFAIMNKFPFMIFGFNNVKKHIIEE